MNQLENQHFLVAGCKRWNRRVFDEVIGRLPGRWEFVDNSAELTVQGVKSFAPRYIFFLHWSWKVPNELIDNYECVCFHMTDVPYGRGGSPLQNLILRGHRQTKLTALRMSQEFDAGPVYSKEDLSLEGNAEEVLIRATYLSARMIEDLISTERKPLPQVGEPVIFKRRKSEESEIPELESLETLHDFIRMLDAEGYPKAFLMHKGFRYEFSRAVRYDGRVVSEVTITLGPEAKQ